jgi:3-deoxy-7-phosphoheptulonate synthase
LPSTESRGFVGGWEHVELTGENVTECLGGAEEVLDSELDRNYLSMCDPA